MISAYCGGESYKVELVREGRLVTGCLLDSAYPTVPFFGTQTFYQQCKRVVLCSQQNLEGEYLYRQVI